MQPLSTNHIDKIVSAITEVCSLHYIYDCVSI